jgi:putative hydrolase of the HAD superfamily
LFGTLVRSFFGASYDQFLINTAAALSLPDVTFKEQWYKTAKARSKGFYPDIRTNIEGILKSLNMPIIPEKIESAVLLRYEVTRQSLALRTDALVTVRELKKRGVKTGLISNCSPDVPLFFPATGVPSLLDACIYSCNAGFMKPDPKIYLLACKKMSVLPQDSLYVGDGYDYELAGATNLGMKAVLIRPAEEPDETQTVESRDWHGPVITCLYDILEFLR